MKDKEKVYDEQIAPLMAKIIEICKTEGIPMFADFQYADQGFCATCIYPPDVYGRNVVIMLYNVLSKCKEQDGVNLDKFVFNIAKNYPNKSSIVLNMLGHGPQSNEKP